MGTEESIDRSVTRVFAALLLGDMPTSDFRQWMFATPDIADVVGEDIYVRLLDIEYGLSSAKQDVIDAVQSIPALQPEQLLHSFPEFQPEQILRSRIKSILCGLINQTIPVKSACQQLAWWQDNGAPWIPVIFIGIESELDGIHPTTDDRFWNDAARVAKHDYYAAIIAYYDRARTEAIELLRIEYNEPCEE